MERAFGVTVTLTSGRSVSASFTATFDIQEYESIEFETGLNIKIVSRNYRLPFADCVVGGATVEPRAGMVITEYDSDGIEVGQYEINPLPGRPAAELQPGGYRWLVHTKEISRG